MLSLGCAVARVFQRSDTQNAHTNDRYVLRVPKVASHWLATFSEKKRPKMPELSDSCFFKSDQNFQQGGRPGAYAEKLTKPTVLTFFVGGSVSFRPRFLS